jgi:lipid-A-disaccharide synthase
MARNEIDYKRVFISVGEVSGDMYGAALAKELFKMYAGKIAIKGLGGEMMAKERVDVIFNSAMWSAIGVIEALKKSPRLLYVYFQLKKFIADWKPELLILIDYPGFNMFLARLAKKMGIPTLYYFPPSKWAAHPDEVKDAANTIHTVAATFKTTYDIYKAAGGNVRFVGHPLLDIVKYKYSREELFKLLGIDAQKKVVGLLPGSRLREVMDLLPVLRRISQGLFQKSPEDYQFIVPLTNDTYKTLLAEWDEFSTFFNEWKKEVPLKVVVNMTYDVMHACDFMVITSGTATMEAAILEKPMVIIYKVSRATEIIARLTKKFPPYFGAPNLILRKLVVPEFMQDNLRPEKVVEEVHKYLTSPQDYTEFVKQLRKVKDILGEKGSVKRVSQIVQNILK